jgi:hypothetical protein
MFYGDELAVVDIVGHVVDDPQLALRRVKGQ